jgi:hypothetical protein
MECDRNPNHKEVDDYGCVECFIEFANQKAWEAIEEWEIRNGD